MGREDLFKGLSKEQIERAKSCRSQVELLALAKEEGVDLSDEQLNAINGGCGDAQTLPKCPRCLSTDIQEVSPGQHHCNSCQYDWSIDNLY